MTMTFLPDWLAPTILLCPALIWLFFGVGLGWALALLPRSDWQHWRDWPMIAATSMMIGPTFTTTAMFVIGTFGHWSVLNVFGSSLLIAAIGVVLAVRRRGTPPPQRRTARPLGGLDALLIGLLVVAVAIRFWNTAYWPYAAYDELWVFGYNAKMFTLTGAIPTSIGYYPQLVPLTLTYGQIAWGGLSEHAARAAVPYFEIASILITYCLAARLAGRRAGLLAAAIWTLYPHHAGWAQYADLEIPTTFLFTGTAAFFIFAWQATAERLRYALISGLFAAAALWTKPTAAALVESIGLIGAVVAVRALAAARPPYRVRRLTGLVWQALRGTPVISAGLTLIPIGGMWYVRNVLLGHPAVVLPRSYWQEAAQRSGQELGWPLAFATALLILLVIERRGRGRALLLGFTLMLGPALISAFDQPHPHHLTILEYGLIGTGALIYGWGTWPWWQARPAQTRTVALLIGAFILPYFVTWFWSYSYHFRLSFAIVPLMIVPLAWVADSALLHLTDSVATFRPPARRLARTLGAAALIALALPAYRESANALTPALSGALPDDHAKQAAANPALLKLVDFLAAKKAELGRPLNVIAPEELRLPYFFPFDTMRVTEFPTRLDEIAGVDYFVDSSVGQRLYLYYGKFTYNQILASLARDSVLKRQMNVDDGDFRFAPYTVDNVTRFQPPQTSVYVHANVGDIAELYGLELSLNRAGPGSRLFMTVYWKALKPAPLDYSVFIHLIDPQTGALAAAWGGEPVSGAFSVWSTNTGPQLVVPYHTRLWQAGEYIKDEWTFPFTDAIKPGVYDLRVGMFDPLSGTRLPITINGQPIGDGYKIVDFTVVPGP
jgi:hypothetical protein